MEFHNSIPITIPNWYLSNEILILWCKSLVADSDCVAILCSVLCSDLVEHIESISTTLC